MLSRRASASIAAAPCASLTERQHAIAKEKALEQMREIFDIVKNRDEYDHRPFAIVKALNEFFKTTQSIHAQSLETLESLVRAERLGQPGASAADTRLLEAIEHALAAIRANTRVTLDEMSVVMKNEAVVAFDAWKDCPCLLTWLFRDCGYYVCCCGMCGCCGCCTRRRTTLCAIL